MEELQKIKSLPLSLQVSVFNRMIRIYFQYLCILSRYVIYLIENDGAKCVCVCE